MKCLFLKGTNRKIYFCVQILQPFYFKGLRVTSVKVTVELEHGNKNQKHVLLLILVRLDP